MSGEAGAVAFLYNARLSDKALIKFIADGDKDALKLLYLRHRAQVYLFALGLNGSESVADEVVNQVFLAVWRNAEQFKGKSQVRTWLLGIARNQGLSYCRRLSRPFADRSTQWSVVDRADGPATEIKRRQRNAILQKCKARVAPIGREAMHLTYYQAKKLYELAVSAMPVATINTHLHDARSRMAKLLAKAGFDWAWAALYTPRQCLTEG